MIYRYNAYLADRGGHTLRRSVASNARYTSKYRKLKRHDTVGETSSGLQRIVLE